jgi:succinylglutamic semialdehyde dehydrogenase
MTELAMIQSIDPATREVVWQGPAATAEDVGRAVDAARAAFGDWSRRDKLQRIAILERFAALLKEHRDDMARAISRETGKPLWESRSEVDVMVGKVAVSIDADAARRPSDEQGVAGARGITRYKPHGVAAVFGPFNLPGHLPNGHIVPALLAGNTVVLKPSEHAPLTGEKMAALWREAGLPDGVLNLVQGARATGEALIAHPGIDAVYFTGSYRTGVALNKALAERPEVILALEMGGNNPLLIHDVNDLDAAAHLTILSAYITAGQRCTCARRLVMVDGDATQRFIERLTQQIAAVRVGKWDAEPQPFMGPVISDDQACALLEAQADLMNAGGRIIVGMKPVDGCWAGLTPGLIDVTDVAQRCDKEHFGPLLQLVRTPDLDAALREVNHTAFGLAAGLFSDDASLYDRFRTEVRAGVVNWNRQTTGASGRLPFGGVGRSGNHRPAGYHSVDYCSYPVASLEADKLAMPDKRLPGLGP